MNRPAQLPARYQSLQEIGRGGAAVVYLAFDTRERIPVAIKILHEKYIGHQEILKRFHREGKMMLTLRHPNMVRLFDFVTMQNKVTYLVMEYVYGWSLRDIIKLPQEIRQDISLPIAHQVATALAFAHSKGIIHRDLKPQNILISSKGEVKLTDFGIAKTLHGESTTEDLTKTGHFVGTPLYSSPEQIAGEKNIDERSDVYSLGCILYEMLVGMPPFQQVKMEELLDAIAYGDYKPLESALPGLHPRICKFHERLMATKPDKRYDSMDTIVEELMKLMQAPSPQDVMNLLRNFSSKFGTPTSPTPVEKSVAMVTGSTVPVQAPVMSRSKVVPMPAPVRNVSRYPVGPSFFRIPQLPASAWLIVIATFLSVYVLRMRRIEEAKNKVHDVATGDPIKEQLSDHVTPEQAIAPAPWVPPVIRAPDPVLPPSSAPELANIRGPRATQDTREEKKSLTETPDRAPTLLVNPKDVKASPYGFVSLAIDLPAQVTVNGEMQTGPRKRYHEIPVFSSTATVKLEVPGLGAAINLKYKVNRSQDTPITINLKKDFLGEIAVISEKGVRVFINDRLEGDSGEFAPKMLPAGNHTVQFVRQGRDPVWKKVTLKPGETVTVREF